MTVKRFTLFALIGAMIAALVLVVAAQDDSSGFKRGKRGFERVSSLILEATGLDEATVIASLKDGSTVAELIEANDGDVDSVIAAMVAEVTAEVNAGVAAGQLSQERADAMLGMIEAEITEGIHGSFDDFADGKGRRGRQMPEGGFGFDGDSNPILEATGLDEATMIASLKDGSTVAELIEANGGDVDSVIAAMVAEVTAEVNEKVEAGQVTRERADVMLGMIEVEITEGIHSSFDDFADGKGRRGRPMPEGGFGFDGDSSPILEATGLDESAVEEALISGSTLAELIEANGGDVDSVIAAMVAEVTAEVNEKVEAGQVTRERADAMLGMIEVEITEGIHSSFDDFADGKGRRGRSMPEGGFGFDGDSSPILEATGLDESAVEEALISGSTLAELIEANGGDVDSVIAAMVAEVTAEVNEKVEAGQVTRERADVMLGMIEVEITEGIHSSFDDFADGKGRRGRSMPEGGFGFDGDNSPILEATGLDESAVEEALISGSTLAELIEANGGDVDSVIAAMVAEVTAEVNAGVAAGQVTRERADAMLGMIEVEITEGIHSSFDDFADGKGRPGHGFGFWGRDKGA